MQYLKSLCRYILLPVSMAADLLTACAISDRASGGRTSEPANKSAQPDTFEHYDAKTLTAQHDFDQLMHQLFLDEVDPAAYGITDYPKTFGGISLEQSREAMSQTAELLVKLENLDSRLLRQDQLLTYRILKSYLTTQLSAKGLELYDQPLSSSLGIQAQLPILLSEYAFYSKQDVEAALHHRRLLRRDRRL